MKNNRINCDSYDYNLKLWTQYEIDSNLVIYPCKFFYLNEINDDSIDHIDNSLRTNKIENILEKFNECLNENIWNSDECPSICIKNCGLKNGS